LSRGLPSNCGVADEKEYHDILLDHYKRWEILRASSERMLGQIRNTPFYSRHPLLVFGTLLPNEIRVAPCKFVGESPFTIVL
jgi:hypothetical protein